jgi:hypothetical protein
LPFDPKKWASNPAEDDEFLSATKIRTTSSFGGEVKPSIPCPKILGMLNNLTSMKINYSYAKFTGTFCQLSPARYWACLPLFVREL